MKNVMLVAQLK